MTPDRLSRDLVRQAPLLRRDEPVGDYMHTEHIDVGADFSDAQLAETFLHHRVLIIPVVDAGQVQGVVTRSDFFRRLGERFLDHQ